MRMGRPQDVSARFAGFLHIVDIPAPAFEKAQILFSAHRLSDRLHAHYLDPLQLPAPTTPATARRSETMPKAVAKSMVEMIEPLDDDDRRREA
jgi:hypothetical protein